MIPPKQLVHALALAKHRSFRVAATATHISQPAFSRSIKSLETALDVQLFNRTEPVTPTAYGERFITHAAKLLRGMDDLESDMNRLKGLQTGTLKVGMGSHSGSISGALAVASLTVAYPDVRVFTRVDSWDELTRQVRGHELELGFAEISEIDPSEGMVTEAIGNHELVFYCRSGHPLAGKSSITDEDLAPFPLAMTQLPRRAHRMPGKGGQPNEAGILVPHIHVEDFYSARTIVAHSDAFGTAPLIMIEPWLSSGEFEVLGYRQDWLRVNYGFFFLQDRLISAPAHAYMQMVREIEVRQAEANKALMQLLFNGAKRSKRKLS